MTLLNGRVLYCQHSAKQGVFLYPKGGIMADGIQVEVDLSKLTKGFDKLGKAGELALKQAARAIKIK